MTQQQAKTKADSLLSLVQRGSHFELLAMEHSDDNGTRFNGGDLGWFPEGMMVGPFNDACFAAKKGDKFIVETQFGFHIVELLDRSREVKKVQVAILERRVEPSSATYQRAFLQASAFAGNNNTYEKFQEAVVKDELSKRIANNLLPADNRITGLESPRELVRWAFTSKEKAVSQVFEFGNRFVVATVAKVREIGNQPFEDVKDEVEIILRKEKKAEIISAKLSEAIQSDASFEELAIKFDTTVENALEIGFASFSIPGAGIEPKVVAYATAIEAGKISAPIAGENGVYVLRVTHIDKPEMVDYTLERNRLRNNFVSRVGFEAYETLKKLANIKDNRSKFF
jgi:peptidyl-prolyl cis-trans isomerase D